MGSSSIFTWKLEYALKEGSKKLFPKKEEMLGNVPTTHATGLMNPAKETLWDTKDLDLREMQISDVGI